ncbi:MAG TPA: hypothetical protein VFP41_08340 [Actinomycetota bacterium]|nr:hypothetical protein [Actinomycetota bacterium]
MVRVLTLAVALTLALAVAAPVAAGDDVRRRGSCSGGRGDWMLRVQRESRTKLRVRFEIDDVPTGQRWQLFISNNGTRVYSRTNVSRRGGEVRVRIATRNRPGRDRIAASGVNTRTGTTCEGSVRY